MLTFNKRRDLLSRPGINLYRPDTFDFVRFILLARRSLISPSASPNFKHQVVCVVIDLAMSFHPHPVLL